MSASQHSNSLERFSFLESLIIPPAVSAGRYQVRFASSEAEIHAAQALRYQVFYKEKMGRPTAEMTTLQRDVDRWDDDGFHIIVLDNTSAQQPAVVGTLRLFLSEQLKDGQQFYTEGTFNLDRLKQRYPKSVELSRFVIDPNGRGGSILMLIWKYAMSFTCENHIQVAIGCASFSGTDVNAHLPILSYLHKNHSAPESLCPLPKVDDFTDLKQFCCANSQWEQAQQSIPTLLRGYIKLGAKISNAAIVDKSFNTVYVAIYVETENMLKQNPVLVSHA